MKNINSNASKLKNIPFYENIAQFDAILNSSGVAVFVKDLNSRYMYANEEMTQLFGVKADKNKHLSLHHIFSGRTLRKILNEDARVSSGELITKTQSFVTKRGQLKKTYKISKSPVRDENNSVVAILGIATDVTELHELNKSLEHQATTDELTGAYNRRFYAKQVEFEMERFKRTESPFCLLNFDIDNLKIINDRLGHESGDMAIRHLVNIVKTCTRLNDHVCRVGGDEFSIIMPNTSSDDCNALQARIKEKLASTPMITPAGETLIVHASFGASTSYADLTDIGELARLADMRLYAAKRQAKNVHTLNPHRHKQINFSRKNTLTIA